MNVPAVNTTATSQPHVRTQQDRSLVRVTLLTQGMEDSAVRCQVAVQSALSLPQRITIV